MLTILMWIGIVLLGFLALVLLGSLVYVLGLVVEAFLEVAGVAFVGALMIGVIVAVVRIIQYVGTF